MAPLDMEGINLVEWHLPVLLLFRFLHAVTIFRSIVPPGFAFGVDRGMRNQPLHSRRPSSSGMGLLIGCQQK